MVGRKVILEDTLAIVLPKDMSELVKKGRGL